jgi:hypothetical protein
MKPAARHCNLLAILCLSVCAVAQAVVPMRAPEDEQPSLSARAHLAQCRDNARQILTQRAQEQAQKNGRRVGFEHARIESESYVQRGEIEYFRFLLRIGNNEIFLVCDGHTGEIKRQIDLWRDL